MLTDWPSGDLFGLTQNAGMGWTADRGRARPVPHPEHARRPARARWPADRAGLSHGPLGDRHPRPGSGRGIEAARRRPVRRHGLRPVRRADPGDGRDDGQPALSQRRGHRLPPLDPLAAAPQRSARDRHLRQGAARHDDGPRGLEASGRRSGARRCHACPRARAKTPARSSRSAPAMPTASSPCPRPPSWAAGPAPAPAAAASFWGRPPRRRSSPRRSASRSRTPRWSRPASRSGATWPADRRAPSSLSPRGLTLADVLTDAAIRNAMVVHAAFGGSTNLLLHIPAIAFAAGLKRPTVDDWHEVNVKVPRLVSVLPNGPFYHPTVRAYLAGGVPEVMLHLRGLNLLDLSVSHGHRRAARARARVVGNERPAQAAARALVRTRRRRSRRRDHEPRAGQEARDSRAPSRSRGATSRRSGR